MKRITTCLFLVFIGSLLCLSACSSSFENPTGQNGSLATQTTVFTDVSPKPPGGLPEQDAKPELEKYFEGHKGAFVLYDLKQNRVIRFNPERCAERFTPASTYKVMNSLISLETGVIKDENEMIRWDGTHYEIPSWNQDLTLKTAIQSSAIWYFQELARRTGKEKIQKYVDAVGYGNRDISGNVDSFWLDGGLRISADEQVDFLTRLVQERLPFSKRSMDITKTILVLEKTDIFSFSGKTGSAQRIEPHTGWFTGTLERRGDFYIFALNYESDDPNGLANGETAKMITRQILQSLGLFK